MDVYERNKQIGAIRDHRRLQWEPLLDAADQAMPLTLLAAITTGDDPCGQVAATIRSVSATLGRSNAEPHPLLAAAALYLALAYGPEAVTATDTQIKAEVGPQPGASTRFFSAALDTDSGGGETPTAVLVRRDLALDTPHCTDCCDSAWIAPHRTARAVEDVLAALHKSWLPRQEGQTK